MLPVIALVGRPNVGKSTLFNALTQTRDALISAYPGMTRDRQYGQVNLYDKRFILIDTGGISHEANEIAKLVTHQVNQALLEADVILFLVDAKAGMVGDDFTIAEMIRRTGKPIVLAANKTEGLNENASTAEAYRLGFPSPIPISALHRTGLFELVESLIPARDTFDPLSADKGVSFAIVGKPNVGKSTLTNRLLGQDRVIVHDSPGTTRDSLFIPFERFGKHYTLIDTAGIRRRKNISETPEKFSVVKTLQAIEKAQVVLYLIDARQGLSDQDLKLLDFVVESGKGLCIAINKWDGLTHEVRMQVKALLLRRLEFVHFARIHYISALHGTSVGNLFESIDEAYTSANKKFQTALLTRLLQAALKKHTPPLIQGRRIKLRYAHAGGHNPPRIIIHGNQVEKLPQSYRRFLTHFFQTKLKLYGTPLYLIFKSGENPYS